MAVARPRGGGARGGRPGVRRLCRADRLARVFRPPEGDRGVHRRAARRPVPLPRRALPLRRAAAAAAGLLPREGARQSYAAPRLRAAERELGHGRPARRPAHARRHRAERLPLLPRDRRAAGPDRPPLRRRRPPHRAHGRPVRGRGRRPRRVCSDRGAVLLYPLRLLRKDGERLCPDELRARERLPRPVRAARLRPARPRRRAAPLRGRLSPVRPAGRRSVLVRGGGRAGRGLCRHPRLSAQYALPRHRLRRMDGRARRAAGRSAVRVGICLLQRLLRRKARAGAVRRARRGRSPARSDPPRRLL